MPFKVLFITSCRLSESNYMYIVSNYLPYVFGCVSMFACAIVSRFKCEHVSKNLSLYYIRIIYRYVWMYVNFSYLFDKVLPETILVRETFFT